MANPAAMRLSNNAGAGLTDGKDAAEDCCPPTVVTSPSTLDQFAATTAEVFLRYNLLPPSTSRLQAGQVIVALLHWLVAMHRSGGVLGYRNEFICWHYAAADM